MREMEQYLECGGGFSKSAYVRNGIELHLHTHIHIHTHMHK
jgi:hypothetical protein